MKVSKIRNGIVIDHILAGNALTVLKILGIDSSYENTVSTIMNSKSEKVGKKDIVKIENRELDKKELDMISLISDSATVNIIKNYEVIEKYDVEIPDVIENVLICTNPGCVSNHELVSTRFYLESKTPIKLRCHYCERLISGLKFK